MTLKEFREWLENKLKSVYNYNDIPQREAAIHELKLVKQKFDTIKFPEWANPDKPPKHSNEILLKLKSHPSLPERYQNHIWYKIGWYDLKEKKYTKHYGLNGNSVIVLGYMEIPE